MSIASQVKIYVAKALEQLYNVAFNESDLTVNVTKPEFEGDYTLVMFSLLKQIKRIPEAAGKEIGDLLTKNHPEFFNSYNIIKGFLNFTITQEFCIGFLNEN